MVVFSFLFVVAVLSVSAFAYDWNTNPGSGDPNDPYQISGPEQLIAVGTDPNLFDRHFILVNDIVLPQPQTTGDNTFNCPVIGDTEYPFTGTFDGQGFQISGLYLEDYANTDYVGLFGVVESTGENSGAISNLTLIAPVIFASYHQNAGALVGHQINGEIFQCAVLKLTEGGVDKGSIVGVGYMKINFFRIEGLSAGGLVGLNNDGHIEQCYSDITIQLEEPSCTMNYTGGLIGKNDNGTIESCYSKATVGKKGGYGEGIVGGLVGYNNGGSVITSYAAAQDDLNDKAVGVLVGKGGGSYFLCYADPNGLETYTAIGATIKSSAEMMCEETFRGWGDGAWVLDAGVDRPRLVWEGTPGSLIVNEPPIYAGSGTAGDPYRIDDANQLNAIGYYRELFDKQFLLMNDIELTSPPNGGSNFQPIGVQGIPFTGSFNGNQKIVSNLTINTSVPYTGLFGAVVGPQAVIENLSLEKLKIDSAEYIVGGLAGYVEMGTLRNCHIEAASVKGIDSIGGLAGWVRSGTIDRCSVSGVIEGINMVGGFIGRAGSGGADVYYGENGISSMSFWIGTNPNEMVNVSRCQNRGIVIAEDILGGFVGVSSRSVIRNCSCEVARFGNPYKYGGFVGFNMAGQIQYCYGSNAFLPSGGTFPYASGYFIGDDHFDPVYTSCYYRSPYFYHSGDPAMPLNDPNMMIQSNYVGWDFAGQSVDGTEEIWRMDEDGVDTPRLNWTFADSGDLTGPDGVGLEDIAAISQCWLSDAASCDFCDSDADGFIGLSDLERLAENWLKTGLHLQNSVLFLSVLEDGPNPDPVSMALSNAGRVDAAYMVQLSNGSNWLDITPSVGNLDSSDSETLSVSVDVVGPALEPGFYEAAYKIISPDAANSPLTGWIALEVVNRYPVLSADTYPMYFEARETGPNPEPYTVTVENTGNEDAHYTIEYPGGQPDWLDVTPTAGTISQGGELTLTFAIDVVGSQLPAGEYGQEVHIVCPEAEESPLVINVSLNQYALEDYPFFMNFPPYFSFGYIIGESNPEPDVYWLDNWGYADVDFIVEFPGGQPDWLTISPTEGTVPLWEFRELTVSVDAIGPDLQPGNYQQDFYIYDNPYHLYPQIYTVTLDVDEPIGPPEPP